MDVNSLQHDECKLELCNALDALFHFEHVKCDFICFPKMATPRCGRWNVLQRFVIRFETIKNHFRPMPYFKNHFKPMSYFDFYVWFRLKIMHTAPFQTGCEFLNFFLGTCSIGFYFVTINGTVFIKTLYVYVGASLFVIH